MEEKETTRTNTEETEGREVYGGERRRGWTRTVRVEVLPDGGCDAAAGQRCPAAARRVRGLEVVGDVLEDGRNLRAKQDERADDDDGHQRDDQCVFDETLAARRAAEQTIQHGQLLFQCSATFPDKRAPDVHARACVIVREAVKWPDSRATVCTGMTARGKRGRGRVGGPRMHPRAGPRW